MQGNKVFQVSVAMSKPKTEMLSTITSQDIIPVKQTTRLETWHRPRLKAFVC